MAEWAECICEWFRYDTVPTIDPACPIHGEPKLELPPREPGAYHDGREPRPGDDDYDSEAYAQTGGPC